MNFFSNVSPNCVPGLSCEIKTARQSIQTLVFRAKGEIVWKITPELTHNFRIQSYKLRRKVRFGSARFHVEKTAWGTPRGLRELVGHIAVETVREQGFSISRPVAELGSLHAAVFGAKQFPVSALTKSQIKCVEALGGEYTSDQVVFAQAQAIGLSAQGNLFRLPCGRVFGYASRTNELWM